jgi:protocatechuate 3,4-dioxygenase beta subunit
MKIIQTPIRPLERGEAVANLQQALISLGFQIAQAELQSSFFGETTSAALRRYQNSNHLDSGWVDEQTAEILNRDLLAKGFLENDFLVSGRVTDATGTPIARQFISVFDVDLLGIPFLDKLERFDMIAETKGFQLLGQVPTDKNGVYTLRYTRAQFINADKSHADLVAFAIQDQVRIAARSRLTTKKEFTHETEVKNLDIIVLDANILRGDSEFTLLMEAIMPILRASQVTIQDLTKSAEQVEFLAQEADVPTERISILTQLVVFTVNDQRFNEADVLFLYALGRQGVGFTALQINDFKASELFDKIKNAMSANIIDVRAEEDIKSFVKRLLDFTAASIVNVENQTLAVQRINQAFKISKLQDVGVKSAFLNAAQRFDGIDPQKFWTEHLPQAGVNADQIQSLKLTNQLYVLSAGHLPLVENMQTQLNVKTPIDLLSLTDADWKVAINRSGLPESYDNVEAFIGDMQNTLHAAYPTQKIADMVQKQEIKAVADVQNPLTAFFKTATDFDFSTKRLEDFEAVIQTVAPQQAVAVRSSLQTLQRVFQISPTPAALAQLTGAGITSAFQVAGVPEISFVKQFTTLLGSEAAALSVHNRASHIVARALDTVMTTQEMTHLALPAGVAMDTKDALETIKKHIPNYENIFGRADICECRDCRSVNSPAAYLVDVLQFLDKLPPNKTGVTGKTPLQVLNERRPDLLHLPLTCENTNTVIPYIDLVNEVLEYYIANNNKLDAKAANDTGKTTASDLRATPQYVSLAAYKKLADTVFPFTLPYHQPLDTLRTFLPNNLERANLMRQFSFSGAAVEAENLQLSEREYALLTGEKFDATPDVTTLATIYGYADDLVMGMDLQALSAATILDKTGISYVDLTRLVKTRFLNPAQIALDFVEDTFKTSKLTSAEVYKILQDINTDVLANPDDNAAVKEALEKRSITATTFVTWVKANFEPLRSLVLLHEPNSLCQVATTYLKTMAQAYESAAAPAAPLLPFLDKMHRFIRLWRRLGWTIEEVDTVLTALKAINFTPSLVAQISAFKTIKTRTQMPIDQLASLFGDIETQGEKPLFSKLFQSKAIQQLDTVFMPDAFGTLFTQNTTILAHKNAILAAFKLKNEELTAILDNAGLTPDLTLSNLSFIYRYTALAKALKVKVEEFIALKRLTGILPFSDLRLGVFEDIDPQRTVNFLNLVEILKGGNLKISELDYAIQGKGVGITDAQIHKTLTTSHNNWLKIETEHGEPTADLDINEAFLRQKMGLICTSENVDLFFGIINNTTVFQVNTDANLAVVIPVSFSNKVKYNKAKGILASVGVLTDAEKTALEGISTPAFKKAIESLYSLPEQQFASDFGRFFTNTTAAKAFVSHSPLAANAEAISEQQAVKRLSFYRLFLPVLKHELRENLVNQALSEILALSETQTAEILRGSITDNATNKTLMDDALKILQTRGFKGEYFNTRGFNAANFISTRTDAAIDFVKDNSFNVVNLPSDNFGCQWTGQLISTTQEERIFTLNVAGADDAFQLFINNTLVLEKPEGDDRTNWEVAFSLEADTLYALKLTYTHRNKALGIRLSWKTERTSDELLPTHLVMPDATLSAFFTLVREVHRGAILVQKCPFSADDIKYILKHRPDFGNIDFRQPDLTGYLAINDLMLLRKTPINVDWLAVFEIAYHPAATLDHVYFKVFEKKGKNRDGGWTVENLKFVAETHFGFGVPQLQNPQNWRLISDRCQLATEAGFTAERLKQWAFPETDFDKIHALAVDIQNAQRSKFDDKEWAEFAPTLNNPLRERRRDALVSYLLVQPELKIWGATDADSLFEYFLIDVQMGACMDTSRVRQAMSSVQLFVTRCLLNLEREAPNRADFWASPNQIAVRQWEWMKLYRVWEANRKVFIYPENWLEPEWRDDRSPFFKELESELTQNDITSFSVETAFRTYLGKLDAVSNLDVVGVFHDKTTDIMHIVARTHGLAPQYFYRNRNTYGRWTAWESLPIDVKNAGEGANNGAHILPMIWKGRLFIFWLEFLEKSILPQTSVVADNGDIKSLEASEAQKQWMVHLSFVEFRDDKWQPKTVSKDSLRSHAFYEKEAANYQPHQYRPYIYESGGFLRVGISGFGPAREPQPIQAPKAGFINIYLPMNSGEFVLTSPQAEIRVSDVIGLLKSIAPKEEAPYINAFMGMKRNYKNGSTLALRKEIYLAKSNGGAFQLAFDHATPSFKVENEAAIPFFCRDEKRHFFVETKDVLLVIDAVKEPEKAPFYPYIEGVNLGISTGKKMENLLTSASKSTAYQTVVVSQNTSENIGVASKTLSSTALFSPTAKTAAAMGGIQIKPSYDFKMPFRFKATKGLTFQNFYHPHTATFIDRLNRFGVADLLSLDTAFQDDGGAAFRAEYLPDEKLVAKAGHPGVKVAFDENDAYGIYNWELFFHAPLYIATRLSKNGKYAEAMQWYHYIFNPMTAEKPDAQNTHFWQVPPFKINAKESIEAFFKRLAVGEATTAETDKIAEWRNNPFKPHLIARGRPVAYMKNVVMKYVENLLAWGDDLFRRDTMESINEATQIYIIAAHILGKRPEKIPKRGEIAPETYASLRDKLDAFGNALVALENLFPYSSSVPLSSGAASAAQSSLLGVGSALYFCIPHNAKLLTYWDTVEDRLFKIRHCLNMDGVERKLSLFDPPIDPSVLVAAVAGGVNLGSALADLFSPSPMYRFKFLHEHALDLCQEVREYGRFLLKTLEKKDAASLALMQSNQATNILRLTEDIRTWHIHETRAYRDTLVKSREATIEKLNHHLDLMAIKLGAEGVNIPPPPQYNAGKKPSKDDVLQAATLIAGSDTLKTPASKTAPVASGESSTIITQGEKLVQDAKDAIQTIKKIIAVGEAVGGALSAIPQFDIAAKPFGVGAGTNIGGKQFSRIVQFANKVQEVYAAFKALEGEKSATTAQFIRREQEWSLEGKLAVREIIQIDRQILTADIRIAMAERELVAHQQHIKNAEEVENFLKTQFTNIEQYQWLKERLFSAHKTAYQLAYDLAKTAERAYRNETGVATSNFIQFGYFDGSHQGLTAGEQLTVALRQLEKAHLDAQKRQFELVKNVSLAKINATALNNLKATGICEFDITEKLLDRDFAGHYYRRIQSVSLSMTTGADATTTVAATLRLMSNSIRLNTTGATYERNNEDGVPIDDERFAENNVPFKAIAISHGKSDTGLFELRFEDARYLPFEGAGAISRWRIEMPNTPLLATIGDVVLHLRYMAKEDVGAFKGRVVAQL